MNESNSSIECYEEWWRTLTSRLGYAIYCVLPPIYSVAGLFGNTALILTCLQKHNNENPYLYQVLVAASRQLFIVCQTWVMIMTGALNSLVWPVPNWWSECYACIWISAHFGAAFGVFGMTIEPLVTIGMLYDRFIALKNPTAYKAPSKRQYLFVSVGSTFLGLVFAAVTFADFYVVPGHREGTYEIANLRGWFAVIISHLRSALFVSQLIISYILNSAVCYLYFKRIRQVKVALTTQQEMKKRAAAKELLIVSITQATFDSFEQLANVLFLVYFYTADGPCYFVYQPIVFEVADLTMVLTTVGQFYFLCAFSTRFRNDARKVFKKNTVTPSVLRT